tara:strand:+ start:2949 stop:3263 length:315 start_codon:yes stop_codon:yes gene_type:complete
MSQVSQLTLDNTAFGTFRSNLNSSLQALNSMHIGSSRPSTAVAGSVFIDNATTNVLKFKVFDGSDDVEIFQINTSTNAVTSNMSVTGTIAETDPQAAALAIALG